MKKRIIKAAFLFILATLFLSCSSFISDFTNKKSDTAQICIKLIDSNARTAMPNINLFNLENFEFYYKNPADSDYIQLKSWQDYESLNNSLININQGTYDFKLCAYFQGITYSDIKTNLTITSGLNNLNFKLSLTGIDLEDTNGHGSFQITVEYPDSGQNIEAITATLYKKDKTIVPGCENEELNLRETHSASYTKTNIPTGNYYVIFNLYADVEKTLLVSTFQENVIVLENLTSTSSIPVTIVNSVCTTSITFVLNGLNWKDNPNNIQYTRFLEPNTSSVLSEDSLDLAPNAIFYGWYESPDFDENTKVQASKISFSETKTLYAKCNQTTIQNLPALLSSVPAQEELYDIIITDLNPNYDALLNIMKNNSQFNFNLDLTYVGFKGRFILPEGYKNCKNFKGIVLPKFIKIVEIGAFNGYENLTSVVISDSVVEIGNCAFYACTNLTSVIIPDSVCELGLATFAECSNLRTITIPDSVSSLDKTFWGCTSLTSISIPNVISIGEHTFEGCSNLTTIILNDEYLDQIGNNAFANCTSLTSIDLPDSVNEIYNGAFSNCLNLTNIDLPKNCSNYGNSLFSGDINLNTVSNLEYYTFTIPESVTIIGPETITNKNAFSIIIPDSVTTIQDNAFKDCTNLISIIIPDSVTSIGNYAFENCTSLNSITISNNTTSIGSYAFKDCKSLTSIIIPESVTTVGTNIFQNCDKLNSIGIPESLTLTIPNTLTSIGPNNIPNNNIIKVIIPDSVKTISANTFKNCYNLTYVVFSNTLISIGDYAFCNCTRLSEITLPETLRTIGSNAFDCCQSLESIEIPYNLETIGSYAFKDCKNLSSVTFLRSSNGKNKISTIGRGAFEYCSKLTSIEIPNSVTVIERGVFVYCENLTSVIISNSVTSITYDTFENCYNLTSIVIPNSVKYIGDFAFAGCYNLSSVTFSNNLISIGHKSFIACDLKALTIPGTVTIINKAFGSENLETITFENTSNWEKYVNNEWVPIDVTNPEQNAQTLQSVQLRRVVE